MERVAVVLEEGQRRGVAELSLPLLSTNSLFLSVVYGERLLF